MVNSNTLDSILDMLKSNNVLKSWSIYNDKYNGDIVVRVRYNGSQCGEAGAELGEGTFKRKTARQAARDQTRANRYKQTNLLLNLTVKLVKPLIFTSTTVLSHAAKSLLLKIALASQ